MPFRTNIFLLSIFCICSAGCGGGDKPNSTETKGSWIHQGTTFTVKTAFAKTDDHFGTKGVTVFFYDKEVLGGVSKFNRDYVEIFFPKENSSYSAPSSIRFMAASGWQTQESSSNGYSGEITSDDGSNVQG